MYQNDIYHDEEKVASTLTSGRGVSEQFGRILTKQTSYQRTYLQNRPTHSSFTRTNSNSKPTLEQEHSVNTIDSNQNLKQQQKYIDSNKAWEKRRGQRHVITPIPKPRESQHKKDRKDRKDKKEKKDKKDKKHKKKSKKEKKSKKSKKSNAKSIGHNYLSPELSNDSNRGYQYPITPANSVGSSPSLRTMNKTGNIIKKPRTHQQTDSDRIRQQHMNIEKKNGKWVNNPPQLASRIIPVHPHRKELGLTGIQHDILSDSSRLNGTTNTSSPSFKSVNTLNTMNTLNTTNTINTFKTRNTVNTVNTFVVNSSVPDEDEDEYLDNQGGPPSHYGNNTSMSEEDSAYIKPIKPSIRAPISSQNISYDASSAMPTSVNSPSVHGKFPIMESNVSNGSGTTQSTDILSILTDKDKTKYDKKRAVASDISHVPRAYDIYRSTLPLPEAKSKEIPSQLPDMTLDKSQSREEKRPETPQNQQMVRDIFDGMMTGIIDSDGNNKKRKSTNSYLYAQQHHDQQSTLASSVSSNPFADTIISANSASGSGSTSSDSSSSHSHSSSSCSRSRTSSSQTSSDTSIHLDEDAHANVNIVGHMNIVAGVSQMNTTATKTTSDDINATDDEVDIAATQAVIQGMMNAKQVGTTPSTSMMTNMNPSEQTTQSTTMILEMKVSSSNKSAMSDATKRIKDAMKAIPLEEKIKRKPSLTAIESTHAMSMRDNHLVVDDDISGGGGGSGLSKDFEMLTTGLDQITNALDTANDIIGDVGGKRKDKEEEVDMGNIMELPKNTQIVQNTDNDHTFISDSF